MHVYYRSGFYILKQLLLCTCCWLCLAAETSSSILSSEPNRCQEILAAEPGSRACSWGNSLLQIAPKLSRTRAVSPPAPEDREEDQLAAPSVSTVALDISAHSPSAVTVAKEQLRKDGSVPLVPVAAAAAVEATLATSVVRVHAAFLQAVRAMRQSLHLVSHTRGLVSVSIFALICLLGLFILCAAFNLQSDNRRAEHLVQGARPSGQDSRRLGASFGSSPQSTRLLAKPQQALASGRSSLTRTLCPGLVVPANQDCVLVIRMFPQLQAGEADIGDAAAGHGARGLDIFDLNGKSVLWASVAHPWPKQGQAVVTLRTLTAPRTADIGWLTICRAEPPAGSSGMSAYIYDKDDALFGCIKSVKDTNQIRYVLNSGPGDLLLRFETVGVSFEEHKVNVLDGHGSMIACVEPCEGMAFEPDGHFYKVRIAAGMDVGLVLSGLLSIDAMEAHQALSLGHL